MEYINARQNRRSNQERTNRWHKQHWTQDTAQKPINQTNTQHNTENSKDNFNIIHFANGGHKRKKMSI